MADIVTSYFANKDFTFKTSFSPNSLSPPHPHPILVPVSALHRSSCGSDCTTVLKNNSAVSLCTCVSVRLQTIGSLSHRHNENNNLYCSPVPLQCGRAHCSQLVSETVRQTDGEEDGADPGTVSPPPNQPPFLPQ